MRKGCFSVESDFYCTKCGNKGIPIARQARAKREAGHLKKLWCPHCKDFINHVECKPSTKYAYEDFLIEFQENNFDDEGNRKKPYSELKQSLFRKQKKGE